MHLSKHDYGVLESRAILILTALGWMSTKKRACVYRHNFTWAKNQLFVEAILILEWFGWINWREFLNPQSNPQHAVSCAIFNDLGGPWQSPRSCKLL